MRQGSAWPWLKITKLHHPSSTTTCLCPKMGYPMIPWQFKCLSVSLSSLFSEFPWGRLHFEPCLRGTARRVLQLWWCFITDVLSFGTSRTPWLDPPSTHKMLLLYLIFLVLLYIFGGYLEDLNTFTGTIHSGACHICCVSHLLGQKPQHRLRLNAVYAVSLGGNHRSMEEHGENYGETAMFQPFLEPFLEETEKLPVNFDPYLLNF